MLPHSISRRTMLALGNALVVGGSLAVGSSVALASAIGFEAYSREGFEAALKGSKPVLVHVHATWCPTCKKQEAVFNELAKTPEFAKLKPIRVDFDMDGDFKKAHNVTSQSIILVFKGGKEVARSGGVTDKDKLAAIVAEAAK